MLENLKIGFIGAGNMAASILGGLVAEGVPPGNIGVSNPSRGKLDILQERYGVTVSQSNPEVAEAADILLLCVKPQKMAAACADLQDIDFSNKCVISVAAGMTLEGLQALLPEASALVRAMPNTPSLVKAGACGLYAGPGVSEQQRQQAEAIFSGIGISVWVDEETQMDVVTALSGSGPAYFFLLIESLCEGAEEQGLPADTARLLAQQTALGAARMVMEHDDLAVAELRRRVTSPGGTTAAGLRALQDGKLPEVAKDAIEAATRRGRELAKEAACK